MLTNQTIERILRECATLSHHVVEAEQLAHLDINNRIYTADQLPEFKRDLTEAAKIAGLDFFPFDVTEELVDEIANSNEIYFGLHQEGDTLAPIIVHGRRNAKSVMRIEKIYATEQLKDIALQLLLLYIVLPSKSLVSDFENADHGAKAMSPLKRFFRLLTIERKEIYYILFYAILAGLIGLVLPLGIQTTVELISGGVFFSSVYILIGVVILGVIFSGVLQIVQISLVEYLQQRIFTKAALEFAYRIPRINIETLRGKYAPELINRFFDVITIQKGLPKLLIDFFAGVIQIFFGLLLLSLYHPFFVFFSLALVFLIVLMFIITGPAGLSSSIQESKYKYKIVHWLEELGRTINSFKLAGTTNLAMRKTDNHVNNYLKYRKKHFRILVIQYSMAVFFKAAITGGLLIMGTILVVNKEITLGQFVASEVIIILVITAIEKIILYMDVIFDLLTAVDKVAHVTDLPLDRAGGVDFKDMDSGYTVDVKNLCYRYDETSKPTLDGINFHIESGEHVCISGSGGSGKSTLTNILAGLQASYQGGVAINGHSLRDLDLAHLRDKIGKNISPEELFEGTVLENITVGKEATQIEDVIIALKQVGADEEINAMPAGLQTPLVSGGKGLSTTFIHKLILARCLAKKPHMIILNDFFSGLMHNEKMELVQSVVTKQSHWTLIAVSNDPLIMAACDRVILIEEGKLIGEGSFAELIKIGMLKRYLE